MLNHQMPTWWLIPLSKWVITPVISGLTPLIPFIARVITHLLSGMSHQVVDDNMCSVILLADMVNKSWDKPGIWRTYDQQVYYHLVMTNIAMENHHF